MFGILLLYFATGKAQASQVVPVVGAVLPLATFLISLPMQSEKLNLLQILGILLLIFGGLLISFDLPLKLGRRKFFSGFYYALGAGILLAVAYVLFKYLSQNLLIKILKVDSCLLKYDKQLFITFLNDAVYGESMVPYHKNY